MESFKMENFGKKEARKEEEKATDMEFASFLAKHINNPCKDQQGNNMRESYIMRAKEYLDTIEDPNAKKLLEDTIRQYEI